MAFYEALSVSPTADSAVLRRAFKRKALLCHPDKSDEPDAEEQFKRLERAWRVLSDPASREAYDARLRVGIDDGADEEPPCGHSEDDEDAYWRAEAAAARRSYEAAMAEAMEEMEEVSEEEAARRRHRERMFLCSVLTFLLLSACTFALLWKALSRQGALFPSPLTLTNRQFGDLSIRDDFRRVTGALVGSHVSRQPWPSRLAAALLRTHTPYLRLRHNATDVRPLQPVQAASLGCPTPAALLATPRRVGDRVLQIHTFVQADLTDPPRQWPPRELVCARLYRSGTISQQGWFEHVADLADGRLRTFRLVAVAEAECATSVGVGAIACTLIAAAAGTAVAMRSLQRWCASRGF